jgi:hypothetical protein
MHKQGTAAIGDGPPTFLERDPGGGVRIKDVVGLGKGETIGPGSHVLARILRVSMAESASTGKMVFSAKAAKRSALEFGALGALVGGPLGAIAGGIFGGMSTERANTDVLIIACEIATSRQKGERVRQASSMEIPRQ